MRSALPTRARPRRPRLALALSALLVAALTAGVGPATGVEAGQIAINVLSNRADLVSAGDALVEIVLPAGARASGLRVSDDRRDVTSAFAVRDGGRIMGLVTGLSLGRNVLLASAPGARAAQITITNHPNGGPIFAGEQIQPWPCFEDAVDAQCNFPARYDWWYMPADGDGFETYDPENPPADGDIAQTTTDEGVTVPYIIREEIGAQDRGEYRIAVLFDPNADWQPWSPQAAWNGKTYITGGSGCGMHHGQTSSPGVRVDNALHRGFAVISTSLDHNTLNCNLVVQAEALMMLKERVVEAYGPIRYTIGSGCSGGSIYQQQVANAYPGIFDGILPACSYPDSWSTMIEVDDCALMASYWDDPSRWAPGVAWTPTQLAAIAGHESVSVCHSWRDVFGFSESLNAELSSHPLNTQDCNVPPEEAFDRETNPDGIRCSLQDYMVSIFGRRPDGKANRPWDNVGVQYGLNALRSGTINQAQFIDLNAKIGSHDIDYYWQPSRVAADAPALPVSYRGGLVNQGNHMDRVPIIDLRGHDTVEIHHDYRSYVMRARLDRENGHHDNQVIWTGALALVGDTTFAATALTVMDEWLAAIEADTSNRSLEEKVVANKPASAYDKCTNGQGRELPADECAAANPYYASPRIVAGSPFTEDAMKCQLKPLRQTDYSPIQFTASQWAQLRQIFPSGVCDWSKPGVDQQPTIAWQTYSAGPGGQPLPAPPTWRPAGTPSSSSCTGLEARNRWCRG